MSSSSREYNCLLNISSRDFESAGAQIPCYLLRTATRLISCMILFPNFKTTYRNNTQPISSPKFYSRKWICKLLFWLFMFLSIRGWRALRKLLWGHTSFTFLHQVEIAIFFSMVASYEKDRKVFVHLICRQLWTEDGEYHGNDEDGRWEAAWSSSASLSSRNKKEDKLQDRMSSFLLSTFGKSFHSFFRFQ